MARTIASSWRTPEIAFTFILVGFLGAFGYNWNAVLPLLARFALDSSALGFGGLNSALGIGSLAGAMFAAGQGRTTVRALAVAATDFSVFLGLLGLAPFYLAAIVLLLAQGFWSVTFSTTANTRVQLTAPPELRGRVMGIYNLVFVGTAPLGAGLTGATVCASSAHRRKRRGGVRLGRLVDGPASAARRLPRRRAHRRCAVGSGAGHRR